MTVFIFEFRAKLADDPSTPTLQGITVEVLADSQEQASAIVNTEMMLIKGRAFRPVGAFPRVVCYFEESQ